MLYLRNTPADIKRYLPAFLNTDSNFSAIMQACSDEHEKLRLMVDDVSNQLFVNTATWGLKQWEDLLELTPKKDSTYATRRKQILVRLQIHQVSTLEFMAQVIGAYTDEKAGHIEEHNDGYWFTAVVEGNILDSDGLKEAIELYKPAHLGYKIQDNLKFYMPCQAKHSLNCHITWIGTQNYWNVGLSNAQTLYWEGTHKLDGQDHTHYFDSTYRFDGIDGNDSYRSDQRHYLTAITLYSAELKDNSRELHDQALNIKKLVDLKQTSNGRKVYVLNKLDSSIKLDGTNKFAGTASGYGEGMYTHSATVTTIKNGIYTEVAI